MKTRIRYKKEGEFLRAGPFVLGDNVIMVQINPVSLIAGLYQDNNTNETNHQIVKASSLPVLKKLVKKELIRLGVKFEPEVRPRFKGFTAEEEIEMDLKGHQ